MFSVRINDIPEEGLQIDQFASEEGWVAEAMTAAFGGRRRPDDEAHVTLMLVRADDQVSMFGGAYIHLHPTCDRCLKVFAAEQQVPIHIVYLPRDAQAGVKESEDVDFGLHDGRQIDVQATITEQTVLAQPMQYLCKPHCRGLCPRCGHDLNQGPCSCPSDQPDSPFSVLRELKLPGKKKHPSFP